MLLIWRTVGWLAVYVLVAVLPLPLGLIDLDPGRGFWINFSVALGFVGLAMLGLQFVLAARARLVVDPVGMDVALRYHRQITYVAVLLVIGHPLILFLYDSAFLPLLNVLTSPLRAKFAVTSVVLLLVLVVTSVWRAKLRIGYEAWQMWHSVLAVAIVITALAHTLLVGYYVRQPWEQALWILLSIAFVALGVWVRIVKPLLRRRRRWVVEEVRPEAGSSTTLVLRLVDRGSYGPDGFRFEAGQFAWILTRGSPFAVTFHPFSFSSSAERSDTVSFTIKALGEFSGDVARLQPGEIVYLDGPYGSFRLGPESDRPLVLIGGGVGVTPLLSMLATLADRGDGRPCLLLLANRDYESRTCGDAIDALPSRLDLTVVHVLADPPPGWTGESGRLDRAMLERNLPADPTRAEYFVCGPPGLMDTVETTLRDLRVPAAQVHAERFEMV